MVQRLPKNEVKILLDGDFTNGMEKFINLMEKPVFRVIRVLGKILSSILEKTIRVASGLYGK